jgi:hypothetical protein
MSRGHPVPDSVIEKVFDLLLEDETSTGKYLKNAVEGIFEGINYTERKYQQMKQDALPEIIRMKKGYLEQPWSVMTRYRIEAQALPTVLKIWKRRTEAYFANELEKQQAKESDNIPNKKLPLLSVRQARWISRVYTAVEHDTDTALDELYELACVLANMERAIALKGGYTKAPHSYLVSWAAADLKLKPSEIIQKGLGMPTSVVSLTLR